MKDLEPEAVIEAAARFTKGEVTGQNRTFAPSVAEFTAEARRIHHLLPFRNIQREPQPDRQLEPPLSHSERVRMSLKMMLYREAISRNDIDALASITSSGKRQDMAAYLRLAREWGLTVPPELEKAA